MHEPPPHWRQRVARGLPFPAGTGADTFTVVVTRDDQVYHVNERSGEVWHRVGERWDRPAWLELPDVVREAVWNTIRA